LCAILLSFFYYLPNRIRDIETGQFALLHLSGSPRLVEKQMRGESEFRLAVPPIA